jgi:hypothetical protein
MASSIIPVTLDEKIKYADAIFRGTVLQNQCFRNPADQGIYTATLLQVDEVFKGRFPNMIKLVHRGGIVGNEGEYSDFSPTFNSGEERVIFLKRRKDNTLYSMLGENTAIQLIRQPSGGKKSDPVYQPQQEDLLNYLRRSKLPSITKGMDVQDQGAMPLAAKDLMPGTTGISARFLACDRGESIPYLVDMDALPSGISSNQALSAISNAFNAWSAVTTFTFEFEGIESFGMAAPNVTNKDYKIRIQLHDLYNFINSPYVLGQGGRAYSYNPTLFPNGGLGGKVSTNEFDRTTRGYLVLEHTNAIFSSFSSLEEVLGHEIGHVISMAHSSTNATEPDAILREALMYYMAHLDGRGASLNSYDINNINLVQPSNNTPSYAYGRVMYVVTSPTPPGPTNILGGNSIQIPLYDLQNDTLTMIFTNTATPNAGTFSMTDSNVVTFTPFAYYSSNSVPPGSGAYFDATYIRVSDGMNLSPPVNLRVVALYPDSDRDGLPTFWESHYGVSNPYNDPDNDTINNINEFFNDTNPNVSNDCLSINSLSFTNLTWIAKGYEVYELQHTLEMTNGFVKKANPTTPTGTVGSIKVDLTMPMQEFLRIKKIP